MASVKETVRDKGWTAWTVWSKDIHDKFEIQSQHGHRMYSKLYIATMIRDKVNMTPIPSQLLFPEEQTNNLPFLLSQVKRMGTFNMDNLDVELEEMKYAENADRTEEAIWSLKVYKQFGRILVNVLNVDDYLIIWGGIINPEAKEVILNGIDTPPCFVTIYRHNGIHKPTSKTPGQYENSCCKQNVDTMFFKGTDGEDVTIVQKIEPRSIKGTTWRELDLSEVENDIVLETENQDTEPQNVAGPSHRLRTPKVEPNILKKAKKGTKRGKKAVKNGTQSGKKNIPADHESTPIDIVDLVDDDSNSHSDEIVVPAVNEESEGVDVIADQDPQDQELEEIETNGQVVPPPASIVSSQTSEEDFPFPVVRESITRKPNFPSVQEESEEIVLYDDTDDESEPSSERSAPSEAVVPPESDKSAAGASLEDSSALADNPEDVDLEESEVVEDSNVSMEPTPSERSTMSPPGTPPENSDRVAQEVAKLREPPSDEMELNDSESTRINAKLLKNIVKFPGSQLLSQNVMVVAESQLFDEIEELDASLDISSEVEIPLNPPSEEVPRSDLYVEDDVEEVEIDEADATDVQDNEAEVTDVQDDEADVTDVQDNEAEVTDVQDDEAEVTDVQDDEVKQIVQEDEVEEVEEVEILEVEVSIDGAGKDLSALENNEKVDLEKEMSALHESDSDVSSEDDSVETNSTSTSTTTFVTQAKILQLYQIKGVPLFHVLCTIHQIYEIRAKNQVILRVSDGTLVPFVTRKGFPLPPGGDPSLTLQVDILVQNCTPEFRRKLKLASQRLNEKVVLSYVLVEKVTRKEYALTMNMNLSSDIIFGDTVPQKEYDKLGDFSKPKEVEAKEASKSTKEKPSPTFNKPGPSSKSIPVVEPEPIPVNTATNVISETPQVEPSTVTHAKRRLTFDHPAPSTSKAVLDKENIEAEILKKYGCHPVALRVKRLRDIPTDKPIVLDDNFYKSHPDVYQELLVSIEAKANSQSDVPSVVKSRSAAKQSKKAVKIPLQASDKKKKAAQSSDESPDEDEIRELTRLTAARMRVPFDSPEKRTSASSGSESEDSQSDVESESEPPAVVENSKGGSKSKNIVASSTRTSPNKPGSRRAVPSPKKNTGKDSDSDKYKVHSSSESDLSQFGSRRAKDAKARELIMTSSDSESEAETPKKAKPNGKKRSPPKKAQNGKSKGKPRVESYSEESDMLDPESPPAPPSPPKKAIKKATKVVESESESEDEKNEPEPKPRTTRKAAALNAKGKKAIEVVDVSSDDSESEKSDTSELKSKRTRRGSPVKNKNNAKAKRTRKALDVSDSDESGSTLSGTKRATKRTRAATKSPSKSPPKKVTRRLRSRK